MSSTTVLVALTKVLLRVLIVCNEEFAKSVFTLMVLGLYTCHVRDKDSLVAPSTSITKVHTMKSLTKSMVVIAAFAAAPVLSFGQSTQSPVSRAQVRAELVQLEKAGYDPQGWIRYPENIEATARAKVSAQSATTQGATSGYGGAADGTAGSGTASGF